MHNTEIKNLPEFDTEVLIVSKDGCVQCDATKRAFGKESVPATVINVAKDPRYSGLLSELIEKNLLQMPMVVTNTGKMWNGFRIDMIKGFAKEVHSKVGMLAAA